MEPLRFWAAKKGGEGGLKAASFKEVRANGRHHRLSSPCCETPETLKSGRSHKLNQEEIQRWAGVPISRTVEGQGPLQALGDPVDSTHRKSIRSAISLQMVTGLYGNVL